MKATPVGRQRAATGRTLRDGSAALGDIARDQWRREAVGEEGPPAFPDLIGSPAPEECDGDGADGRRRSRKSGGTAAVGVRREPYGVVWAYCVAMGYSGFAFMTLVGLITGAGSHDIFGRGVSMLGGIIMCITAIPMLAIPTRIAHLAASLLPLKAGARHILTGTLVGAIPLIHLAVASASPGPRDIALALVAPMCGAVGGFTYWRLRGYPEAGSRLRRLAQKLYRMAPRLTRWAFRLRPA